MLILFYKVFTRTIPIKLVPTTVGKTLFYTVLKLFPLKELNQDKDTFNPVLHNPNRNNTTFAITRGTTLQNIFINISVKHVLLYLYYKIATRISQSRWKFHWKNILKFKKSKKSVSLDYSLIDFLILYVNFNIVSSVRGTAFKLML